jgi:hypothetical protein
VCDCGTPDDDGDSDGTPDCDDGCPSDPNKTAAGVCGCGVADDDSDSDGTLDCNDGCPNDPLRTSDCFPFTPSNFDPSPIDYSSAPDTTIDCGDVMIDTTDPDGGGAEVATITGWCGPTPTPIAQAQTSGMGNELVVIPLSGLTLQSGRTITIVGTRPLVFAVIGDAVIDGTISANASGTTPGPGGNFDCAPATTGGLGGNGTNGPGSWPGDSTAGASGGGGGGFGTNGGNGGISDTDNNPSGGCNDCPGGGGGQAHGSATLVPLLAGCAGGLAGSPSTCSPQAGGAGGGAVQITASASLTVSGTLRSNGGDGHTCEPNAEGGGTGGGSGGALLLEGDAVDLNGATLTANGGQGGANGSQCGLLFCGNSPGGNGSTSPSNAGSAGQSTSAGGPGGGGGYGRRYINAISSCVGSTLCP